MAKPKFSEREIVAVLTMGRKNLISMAQAHPHDYYFLVAKHQAACLGEAIRCVRSVYRRRKKP